MSNWRAKVRRHFLVPRFSATSLSMGSSLVKICSFSSRPHGVTSHGVSVRIREFGIRRALGAGTGNVLGLVIRRALIILAVGVVLGVGASLALTRFLERFLWGVTGSDPTIFAAIAVILIATGLIAGVVPASRAARVDPLVALRHE
jgi:ABC-type antimicrobial peptide transport system permease subunit